MAKRTASIRVLSLSRRIALASIRPEAEQTRCREQCQPVPPAAARRTKHRQTAADTVTGGRCPRKAPREGPSTDSRRHVEPGQHGGGEIDTDCELLAKGFAIGPRVGDGGRRWHGATRRRIQPCEGRAKHKDMNGALPFLRPRRAATRNTARRTLLTKRRPAVRPQSDSSAHRRPSARRDTCSSRDETSWPPSCNRPSPTLPDPANRCCFPVPGG